MTIKLMPSLMACPTFALKDYLLSALDMGVDTFHIDIMDGSYVPNYAMSPAMMKDILQLSPKIHLQAHMMCLKPAVVYENFCKNNDRIDCYIHNDQEGARELLEYDNVYPTFNLWQASFDQKIGQALAMAVPVGFCGQSRPFNLIEALDNYGDLSGITLDGGIKYEDLASLTHYNLQAVVIGSGIFSQEQSPEVMTRKIANMLESRK